MRIALLSPLLLLACAPLDRSSPYGEAGYVAAVDEIGAAVRDADVDRGAFVAGWGKALFEVPADVPLAGYGDRGGAPHEGHQGEVGVRAFVFGADQGRILVFAADVLLVDPLLVEAVMAELGPTIDRRRVFFTASHTHSGPGGFVPGLLWEIAFGGYDARAFDAVVHAHVEAARVAFASVRPARIGSAHVPVVGLVANRVEVNGPLDEDLFLLRFEHLEDGRAAALWVYGCHAVTRPASNLEVSADYPGDVAARFEGHGLDLLAFAAGGVGSANPKHERKTVSWLVDPLTRAVARALKIAEKTSKREGRIASANASVVTPRFRYRVTDDMMLWAAPIEALVDMPELTYGAIAIDDTVWTFMPAEISGELTRAMKRDARRGGVSLAVTSFNGTYVGYVVSRRVYDLDPALAADMHHYESQVMAFLGPYAGDMMVNLGLRIARGVHGRP